MTDRRDTEPAPPTPLAEKLAQLSRTYGGKPYSAVMATIPAEELRLLYCVAEAARIDVSKRIVEGATLPTCAVQVQRTAAALAVFDAYKADR